MTSEEILLRFAAVIAVGVGAQWAAGRLRIPSIFLLLIAGFVLGRATGFLDPAELLGELLVPFVSVSVAIILFEGGLTLRVADLPHVGGVVRNLIVFGVLITWGVVTPLAYVLLDLSWPEASLLGAILVVTGPTVVIPLLEHIRPAARMRSILRWEGIVIDPVGATLAVLVFEAVRLGELQEAATQTILGVLRTIAAGAGFGALGAFVMVALLRRYWIPDSLQNPVTLALVIGAATLANIVESESGLLAATVMGIALANQRIVAVRHIVEFKENLRVLLIGSLFIILAAQLETSDFTDMGVQEALFVAVLILAVRPLAVTVSTFRSSLDWKERAFLAWMAPRGIVAASVASIFALRLAQEGSAGAARLVPLTFLVIVGTIVVYGLSGAFVARRLGLARPNPQGMLFVGAHGWAREIAGTLKKEGFDVALVDTNRRNIAEAQLAGLRGYYASILSEGATDDTDLEDIGRLLAMTPNDEANSLAAQHYAERFTRANVFQLAPSVREDQTARRRENDTQIPRYLRGRLLFGEHVSFNDMEERFASGASVKVTKISETFSMESFRKRYGEEALPLFVITQGQTLSIFTADSTTAPRAGQKLVSLVFDVEESKEAEPEPIDAEPA